MDRAEALNFIGLKEPVNKEAVLSRYNERYNYYHMLYANAPNKVIQKIQQTNLDKLNLVKQVLLDEMVEKKNVRENKLHEPAEKANGVNALQANGKPVMAWLIVHTENRRTETFNLFEGPNFIGRKKRDGSDNSIIIEDDPFMSRTHALIKCRTEGDHTEFKLYDGDGSKPSINGVFVNGHEKRIKKCYLRENDTIQIGTTKLMFKVNKANTTESQEVEAVLSTEFIKTIDVSMIK